MIEMPEGEPSAEEVNAQVLRALRDNRHCECQGGRCRGAGSGLLGRSMQAAGTEKRTAAGAFECFEETDFQAVSAFVEQKIRQAGRQILDGKIA